MIDLQTGEVRSHSPDNGFTFNYNGYCNHSNPDYHLFLWYLASMFPDIRDCLTAIDIIAAVGIRIPFEVFIFLLGGGENGKGILEKLILALYTMQRCAATKLQEINKSHFASGFLLNKDAWIITEVDTVKDAISVIKGISTGEMVDSDVKYATERAQGIPHVLPIIDSNKALDFKDNSWGRVRRTEKLDCPYEFGYKDGVRPKDPHLLDKLTTPESLAGIVQIIKARSPTLIKSRRIYHRKSHEAQEAELERQKYSIQYFCNDCLDTKWPYEVDPKDPRTEVPKLEVPDAYASYLEYCKLFNVPEPAHKNPFGKYLVEKYQVKSKNSSRSSESGKKEDYRYYPNLFLVKSAKVAYAEFSMTYDSGNVNTTGERENTPKYYSKPSNTTAILQEWLGKNSISKDNTTGTTGEVVFLTDIIEILEKMYEFINSCKNPKDISYREFLAHFPVVPVVLDKNKPVDNENKYDRDEKGQKTPVVLVVSSDRATASSIPTDKPVDIAVTGNMCKGCGKLFPPEEFYIVDNDLYCGGCYSTLCIGCKKHFHLSSLVDMDGLYCPDCAAKQESKNVLEFEQEHYTREGVTWT